MGAVKRFHDRELLAANLDAKIENNQKTSTLSQCDAHQNHCAAATIAGLRKIYMKQLENAPKKENAFVKENTVLMPIHSFLFIRNLVNV